MAKIPTRQLGKNGPQVSATWFWSYGFINAFYGTLQHRMKNDSKFLIVPSNLVCTYFDSADIYGDNEDLTGKIFQKISTINVKRLVVCRFFKTAYS